MLATNYLLNISLFMVNMANFDIFVYYSSTLFIQHWYYDMKRELT